MPPPVGRARGDGAAVRLDHLPDDREPEPGAGRAARSRRAVEAVEDVRQVLRRRSPARGRGRSPRRPRRAPRPSRRSGSTWRRCRARSRPHGRSARARRGRATRASSVSKRTLGACRRARSTASRDEQVEPDVLDVALRLAVPGEVDDVGDEHGQLLELRRDVGERLRPLVVREPCRGRAARRSSAGDVSGVRSSCDASATSCRCACCDSSSAASIVLKLVPSRPSSSCRVGLDAAAQVARRR